MKRNEKKWKLSPGLVGKILVILLIVVFVSGILLGPLQDVLAVKLIHKLSAVLLVVGILVHVLQQRKKRG